MSSREVARRLKAAGLNDKEARICTSHYSPRDWWPWDGIRAARMAFVALACSGYGYQRASLKSRKVIYYDANQQR